VILDQREARSAADQVWPAFVLVAGLLLVGLVADQDGLFAAVGHRLAELAPNPLALFAGAAAMVAVVTAVLNLDTSVVFVTPVLIYACSSAASSSPTPEACYCPVPTSPTSSSSATSICPVASTWPAWHCRGRSRCW
jgi:arsenical pump membrane protein